MQESERTKLLDEFGKMLIYEVRDYCLTIAVKTVNQQMKGQKSKEIGEKLAHLSSEDKDTIIELLSKTITNTIYELLHTLGYSDQTKLLVIDNGVEYDIKDIDEEVGAEITFLENGWIQRFSKIDWPQ